MLQSNILWQPVPAMFIGKTNGSLQPISADFGHHEVGKSILDVLTDHDENFY